MQPYPSEALTHKVYIPEYTGYFGHRVIGSQWYNTYLGYRLHAQVPGGSNMGKWVPLAPSIAGLVAMKRRLAMQRVRDWPV